MQEGPITLPCPEPAGKQRDFGGLQKPSGLALERLLRRPIMLRSALDWILVSQQRSRACSINQFERPSAAEPARLANSRAPAGPKQTRASHSCAHRSRTGIERLIRAPERSRNDLEQRVPRTRTTSSKRLRTISSVPKYWMKLFVCWCFLISLCRSSEQGILLATSLRGRCTDSCHRGDAQQDK